MVAAIGSAATLSVASDRFHGGRTLSAETSAARAGEEKKAAASRDAELTEEEQQRVRDLKDRDAEVRAHEQAHASAGGTLAGAPSYQTERGPDGRTYAVGGEVAIDVSPARTPEATLAKADQIVRAALAPADPSSQDMRVAAAARQMRAEAQAELIRLQAEEQTRNTGKLSGEESGNSAAAETPASEQEQTTPRTGATADAGFAAQRAYDAATRLLSPLPA
ncbi:putative metalloprotease CJM1_0395 family protein [Breoghania sp. JC706]|uniref:putative metalloprotease CJM1_0395 family protein n=1 Tax=Breoghania sp. JC706 TaxID=3117732 RepID=UPI00300B8244